MRGCAVIRSILWCGYNRRTRPGYSAASDIPRKFPEHNWNRGRSITCCVIRQIDESHHINQIGNWLDQYSDYSRAAASTGKQIADKEAAIPGSRTLCHSKRLSNTTTSPNYTMCEFKSRVRSCGHYKTTLWNPCDNAKRNKTPCDVPSSSEDSSTTGGMCYLSGCDRKPTGKREGPGKSIYITIP